jgi:[ribosomal protein S5]-alanine N-acetyltransferase
MPAATLIRAPGAADREAFIAAVRVSRSLHGRWVQPPDTAAAFAQYLRRLSRPENAGFLVVDRADGGLVGFVNVNEIVLGAFASGYLGYAAFAGKAGRGLMRDGLGQVIGAAFGRMSLHRLEANIQPSNLPSIALITRLGFRHEGFSPRYLQVAGAWRDHERFALTTEDWAAQMSGRDVPAQHGSAQHESAQHGLVGPREGPAAGG